MDATDADAADAGAAADNADADAGAAKSGLSWYVVHVHSGFEAQVRQFLEERIERYGMQKRFGQIMMPKEEIVEMRSGQKRTVSRKFFPGYLLVEMDMDEDTWHLVKDVPRVLGFVGGSREKPTPIAQKEVDAILNRIREGAGKPMPRVVFEPGEVVRVIDGPFNDFNGAVEEVNYEKNRLLVLVQIFGRSTPVELDFDQVEKT